VGGQLKDEYQTPPRALSADECTTIEEWLPLDKGAIKDDVTDITEFGTTLAGSLGTDAPIIETRIADAATEALESPISEDFEDLINDAESPEGMPTACGGTSVSLTGTGNAENFEDLIGAPTLMLHPTPVKLSQVPEETQEDKLYRWKRPVKTALSFKKICDLIFDDSKHKLGPPEEDLGTPHIKEFYNDMFSAVWAALQMTADKHSALLTDVKRGDACEIDTYTLRTFLHVCIRVLKELILHKQLDYVSKKLESVMSESHSETGEL
jgi:hypothetical protein